MVIIKEDNVPPLKWNLGRIVRTHAGPDNLVRVADVRTANGIKRRAIHKLAPLPTTAEQEVNFTEVDDARQPSSETTQQETNTTNHTMDRDNVSTEAEVRPKKKQRRSFGSAISTLLLVCLFLPLILCAPVEIKPFQSQPGIYFENLGGTNIISSEWNLVAFYDMEPFWSEFDALRNSSRILENLCQQINEQNSCEKIVEHFQHLTTELSANNELLLPTENRTRTKRGAVNFIGNIANSLFGILDSEYAEKMSVTINDIQQNENHLAQLIKNQTSIIDATINIIRRDQDAIEKQFKDWETHINKITEGIDSLKKELRQEKLSNLFTTLAMHAMLTASNFHRIQMSILDVLADTHNGKISPQLITPGQLKQELSTIKGHLPSSLKLPVARDNILQFYNMMTIQGRATKNHIIFKLNLPLCTLEDFELFGIIPIPTLINNTFLGIQPPFPYLLVNLHRDQYYPLSQHNLQSCTIITGNRYLCKQNHPIYRKGSALSACEMNFINHLPPSPTCTIVRIGDGPHWIQLHNPNQWIYAVKEKTTINVVCNDNVAQVDIEESGLLTLQSECTIKQPLITIRGHNTFPTSSRMSYMPATNLTQWVKLDETFPELQEVRHLHLNRTELEVIQTRLQNLRADELTTIHHHDTHQFAVGYTGLLLSLIVIAIICIGWILRNKIWQRIPPKPVPKPRRFVSRTEINSRDQQDEQHPDFYINFED